MVFKVSFTPKEIEQLYLTFLRNPKNYGEIKKRLVGEAARFEFRKSLIARMYFMAALTVIAIASSMFSFFAEHWASMGAIWIIWAGFMIGMGVAMYLSYQDSYLVLKKNEAFFIEFESIARSVTNLEDFIISWNLRNGSKMNLETVEN
jgi:hypothetical protein